MLNKIVKMGNEWMISDGELSWFGWFITLLVFLNFVLWCVAGLTTMIDAIVT